jgi:hypothetical protein
MGFSFRFAVAAFGKTSLTRQSEKPCCFLYLHESEKRLVVVDGGEVLGPDT